MKDEMIDNQDTSSNKMKDDFIRHLCPSMILSAAGNWYLDTAWWYIDKDSLEWPELGPIYKCTMTLGEHQTPSDKLGLKQIF